MPFTFSHPAVVLPAKYLPPKWVSMTALVIGSITPDFEYFIRMRNVSLYSHSWSGLFWFDLPLAFILTFIYHRFVRDALIDNLPRILRDKMTRFKRFNWTDYVKQNFFVVVVCLCVGITTHLIWDGFTHPNGYFVSVIPWLKYNITVFGIQHTRFHVLQVISSIMGGLMVIFALLKTPTGRATPKKQIFPYWVAVMCIAIIVVGMRVNLGLDYKKMPLDLIMTAFSGILIGFIITPLILRHKPN